MILEIQNIVILTHIYDVRADILIFNSVISSSYVMVMSQYVKAKLHNTDRIGALGIAEMPVV